MTDQHPSGAPSALPAVETPGEDGSDFYNTPQTAQTPVNQKETQEKVAETASAGEQRQSQEQTAAPQPYAQLPGLSLTNDSNLHDVTTGNNQSTENQNTEDQVMQGNEESTGTIVEAQLTATTQDATDATNATEQKQPQPELAPATGEAMEMDQKLAEPKPEGVVADASNTTVSGAAPTDAAQDGQQEQQGQGQGQEEEHPEWEEDSSPYESSSDDSTDSSDESDDDDEDYPILSPEEQARILMQAEAGSDDEGEGKGKPGGHIKTANEIQEDAPAIPDVTVTPEMKVVLLGHVQAIVENTALIEANVSGEYQVLEAGSLLCSEDRKILGVVCETLGRVENPLYTVRYASPAGMEEYGITQGKQIYYVEPHSSFVFTQPLKGLKGSDASNFHDEEVGEEEAEFSDDEAEAEYRRKQKQKRQEKKEARGGTGPAKAKRGPPGPSKLHQTEQLNYDDDAGEDGYTPLARPKNLPEMMAYQAEAPVEGDGPPSRGPGFRGGRGRGRGFDRGRGGRGRGGGPRDQGSYRSSAVDSQSQQQQQPQPQPQFQPQPTNYAQPPFGLPQQFPSFAFPQQLPQQPYAQGTAAAPSPFPFQMSYLQAFQQQQQQQQQQPQQPNPYQQVPHVNPLFLAALQQQQQQQQQFQQQQQQPQAQQAQQPAQTMNFDQVKAQLDLLRQLSNNGNQGPPPS